MGHAVWLNDREIELLGQTATGVAYNPVSNEYLASGVFRLRAVRSAGGVVGLGTDGAAVSGQDLFECAKQAVLLQRVSSRDPVASDAEEALELATREGARYLGIDAGILAPGKLADLIVVDLRRPHIRPLHRAVSALVYSTHGSDVELTVVGGRTVYENARCQYIDVDAGGAGEGRRLAPAGGNARAQDSLAGIGALAWPTRRSTVSQHAPRTTSRV